MNAEYNAGVDAQERKNYPEAIQHYLKAIEEQRRFPEAWNNLGFCYRMVARNYLDKSNEAYNRAIEYKPNFEDALEYQGELFAMTGQLKNAYENYLALKQMNSRKADILKKRLDGILIEAQSVLGQYSPR